MLVDRRFTAPLALIILTAGGLLLTTSFHGAENNQSTIPGWARSPMNQGPEVDGEMRDHYYCQAARPSPKNYPAPKVKSATLRNVQLFIRHGDRTPITVLPLDLDVEWDCSNRSTYAFSGPLDPDEKSPYRHANVIAQQVVSIADDTPFARSMWKGSCNPGQLTPKGALQHRQLGAALRRIYVDELGFLSKSFHPERTYIRSTDLWRTRQSAENLMVGLYGSQKHGLWGSPIPPLFTIHTLPTEIDYLTMNGEACPRIQQLRAAAEKASPVLKRLHEEEAEFEEELQGILGAKRTWSGYMDTVLPRVCHGIPLQCRATEAGARPHCITMNMADRILKNVATQSAEVYRDMTGMFEILQLGMGPLAKDIRKNLLNAQNEDDLKFKLYSGHDTTLAPLLGLLDGADMRWPPYASNLLIELWSSHGEYFVRVIYNQEFVKTQSDWCDLEWCPLDKFVAYLGKFVLDDLTEKCLKK